MLLLLAQLIEGLYIAVAFVSATRANCLGACPRAGNSPQQHQPVATVAGPSQHIACEQRQHHVTSCISHAVSLSPCAFVD